MELTVDVFRFRQDSLPCTAFAAFKDMRKKEQLCDLTIRVQDHSFRAHRVIVAGVIPYFRTVLTGGELETEKEEFGVDDLEPKALESLIDFAYTGEVNITMENGRSLLIASQFLLLNQVRDACVEFLTERLRVDNVIQVRELGQSLSNLNLIANCDLYTRKSFEEFSKCDDFFSLSHSRIKEIISQDDLNVDSEEIVLRAVMNWVKVSPTDRHAVLPDLLSEVRMIYLPTDCLMSLAASEELIRTSIACRDIIDELKSYHFSKSQSALSSSKTEPRKSTVQNADPVHVSSSVKDCIYAVHCVDSRNISVYCCDIVHKKWDKVANTRASDSFCFAAATNEKIYMFLTRTILTFHPKTSRWEVLESGHENIKTDTVVFHESVIYMCDHSSYTSVILRCFDTKVEKWLGRERIMGRKCSAAASLKDSVYFTGGFSLEPGSNIKTLSIVEKYNPSTNQWSEVSSMLTARYSHGCTSLNQKTYVCGGLEPSGFGGCVVTTKAEVYDPLTDQWNFISSMETPRRDFSLVSCNDKIYAVGGFKQFSTVSDSETYNAEDKHWDTSFPLPDGFSNVLSVPAAVS